MTVLLASLTLLLSLQGPQKRVYCDGVPSKPSPDLRPCEITHVFSNELDFLARKFLCFRGVTHGAKGFSYSVPINSQVVRHLVDRHSVLTVSEKGKLRFSEWAESRAALREPKFLPVPNDSKLEVVPRAPEFLGALGKVPFVACERIEDSRRDYVLSRIGEPSLGAGVLHIFFLGAFPKMERVTARGVIASVQNNRTLRYWSCMKEREGDSMGQCLFRPPIPVTLIVFYAIPFPTYSFVKFGSYRNVFPEAYCNSESLYWSYYCVISHCCNTVSQMNNGSTYLFRRIA